MTAEIAILNKNGVALAADSAVTVSGYEKQKIWPSAEKLFSMSSPDPIGIMVYGGAELLGVPWETVIKSYRRSNPGISRRTLAGHAKHFMGYLDGNRVLFPAQAQTTHLRMQVRGYFGFLVECIRDAARKHIEEKKAFSGSDTKALVSRVIEHSHRMWSSAPWPSARLRKLHSKLVRKHG